MHIHKGAVRFKLGELQVPLAEGDIVPCPKCAMRHFVMRDPRPGRAVNTQTGEVREVRNEALYVECPEAAGPIVVGMDGRVLPLPLQLTWRHQR